MRTWKKYEYHPFYKTKCDLHKIKTKRFIGFLFRWIYHAMATHHDLKLNNDNNIFSGTWYTCPLHESSSSSTSSSSSLSSRCTAKSNPFLNRRNLTQSLHLWPNLNTLSGIRWFWIFWYFERNVPLQLPRHYSLPLPRSNMLAFEQQNLCLSY